MYFNDFTFGENSRILTNFTMNEWMNERMNLFVNTETKHTEIELTKNTKCRKAKPPLTDA